MEVLTLKIRLAVLWIFMAVAMSAYVVLAFMTEGAIEAVTSGEFEGIQITDASLWILALFWLIPLTMAFLSVTLKDSMNRWANMIAGLGFAIVYIIAAIGTLSEGETGGHLLMEFSKAAAAILVVWYAWKWPRQEAGIPA